MKSETVETDRIKIESRQSIHRRRMSKNSPIVNGAGESLSYAASEDEYEVKLVAAALQDHLPYTKKSSELCKVEPRATLACETDHIYANSSSNETKSKSQNNNTPPFHPATTSKLTAENEKMRKLLIVQFELIKRLERDRNSEKPKRESVKDRKKARMAVLRSRRKSDNASADNASISQANNVEPDGNVNLSAPTVTSTTAEPSAFAVPETSQTIPPVNLVTRYFGRRSKTIPSRALKRRYLGPPKTIPPKKPTPVSLSSLTSVSSESEVHEDEMVTPKIEPMDPKESSSNRTKTSLIDIKRITRKRGKGQKALSRISDFLTTDKTYYWPHIETTQSPLVVNETVVIDVPTWKVNKVHTFYQMEGTENINDPVFERRHLKYELDERRRKKWDIQRLREQKASEKLKYKNGKNVGKEAENNVKQKAHSFYPRIQNIEYVEITDQIPVLAFGYPIPLFQPSEFSLSWKCAESSPPIKRTLSPPNKVTKRGRLSNPTAPKIT